jgi:hypothetical protein
MKQRIVAALFLAGLAGAAFSQDSQEIYVESEQACPAGTFELVPSYTFQDRRFVRNGKLCKGLYTE